MTDTKKLKEEVRDLKEKKDLLRQYIEADTRRRAQVQAEAAKDEFELLRVKKELVACVGDVAAIKEDIAKHEPKQVFLKKEVSALELKSAQLQRENKEYSQRQQNLKDLLLTQEGQLNDYATKLQKLKQESEQVEKQIQEVRSQKETCEQEIEAKQRAFHDQQKTWETKIKDSEKDYKKIVKKITDLNFDAKQKQYDALVKEMDDLRTQRQEREEEEITKFEKVRDQLVAEIQTKKLDFRAAEDKHRQTLISQREELYELTRQKDTLERNLRVLEAEKIKKEFEIYGEPSKTDS